MNSANRRYEIDRLRVFEPCLLIICHVSIVFQPWPYFIYFDQNNDFRRMFYGL